MGLRDTGHRRTAFLTTCGNGHTVLSRKHVHIWSLVMSRDNSVGRSARFRFQDWSKFTCNEMQLENLQYFPWIYEQKWKETIFIIVFCHFKVKSLHPLWRLRPIELQCCYSSLEGTNQMLPENKFLLFHNVRLNWDRIQLVVICKLTARCH